LVNRLPDWLIDQCDGYSIENLFSESVKLLHLDTLMFVFGVVSTVTLDSFSAVSMGGVDSFETTIFADDSCYIGPILLGNS